MRHADDGALRRMLDEPFAVAADVRRHLEGCPDCRARAAAIADEARATAAVLAAQTAPNAVDAAAAYRRFAAREPSPVRVGLRERLSALVGGRNRRYAAPAFGVLAAALIVVALVFTPIGTLAQSFLTIFEPHQFVAINVSKGELQYLPDLTSFGTMTQRGAAEHREVASPQQAYALTHIRPRLPAFLPPGLPQPVHYVVVSPVSASFQFTAAKARQYAMSAHEAIPPMPPGLDGSVLSIHAGPMFVMSYGDVLSSSGTAGSWEPMRTQVENGRTYIAVEPLLRAAQVSYRIEGTRLEVGGKAYPYPLVRIDGMPMADAKQLGGFIAENSPPRQHVEHISHDEMSALPPLVIVEAVAPRVYSTGATAQEIESYLLRMPGVAPQLADEIRAIGDPSTTMPIPVPIDKAYSQYVAVDGTRGLAIGDDTGVGGIIVWQRNGIVYGVGGGLPQRTLMEVAQSLR